MKSIIEMLESGELSVSCPHPNPDFEWTDE